MQKRVVEPPGPGPESSAFSPGPEPFTANELLNGAVNEAAGCAHLLVPQPPPPPIAPFWPSCLIAFDFV